MRFKKLIGGLALAATLALGVGAALSVRSESEAKAATSETTFYVDVSSSLWGYSNIDNVKIHMWGDTPGDVYIYDVGSGRSIVDVGGVNYVSFSIASHAGVSGFDVYCWEKTALGNSTVWTTFDSFSEGQNLITVGNNGDWNANQPVTLGTLVVGTTYTVSKHAVVNGTLGESLGSDSVEEGATYAVPANASKDGYHFVGWYSDQACTVAYTAQAINADKDIYAKFVDFSKDSYIYYVTGTKEYVTPNKIHTWGGEKEYPSSGAAIASVGTEVSGVITFKGVSQEIYKIPVSSESGDTKFKFFYGDWDDESPEKTLVAGHAYKWEEDAYFGEEDAGLALDFLLALEAKRNAVSASGSIKDYSVCGISASDAAALCIAYNALPENARLYYVDASDVYTYDRQDSSKETNVSVYDIMEELSARANVSLQGHSSVRFANSLEFESTTGITVITIIAIVSISAVAVLLVLKKRKHN